MERGEQLERLGVPVRDAGYRAIDSLSAEKSYRHWHADLASADTPFEACIGFTVLPKLKRSDAPDFLGRRALEEQRAAGLRRRLVTLVLDDPLAGPMHGGETLWRDGECVGIVRSVAYGHTIGATIVSGYVRAPAELKKITPSWLRDGMWSVGDKGTAHSATLHLKPPFDPNGDRPKGIYAQELLHVTAAS